MALGNHLMLAGLIFQIVSLVLFALACGDFAIRARKFSSRRNPIYSKLRASAKFRGFLWAATVSFATIFTRCVYRVIELGGGWNNSLMREETPFIILESWYAGDHCILFIISNCIFSMIVIAVYALIAFHPGFGFQNKFNEIKYQAMAGVEGGKEEISLNGSEHAPCLPE
jgi:hypothetical protein